MGEWEKTRQSKIIECEKKIHDYPSDVENLSKGEEERKWGKLHLRPSARQTNQRDAKGDKYSRAGGQQMPDETLKGD